MERDYDPDHTLREEDVTLEDRLDEDLRESDEWSLPEESDPED